MLDPWVSKRKDVLSDYLITIVFVVPGSMKRSRKPDKHTLPQLKPWGDVCMQLFASKFHLFLLTCNVHTGRQTSYTEWHLPPISPQSVYRETLGLPKSTEAITTDTLKQKPGKPRRPKPYTKNYRQLKSTGVWGGK